MANDFSANQTTVLTPGFDLDNDGVIDPGERVTTTVTITNNGTIDATGVTFAETLAGMTIVNQTGNDINVSPIAFNDSYNAIGNTLLEVGNATAQTGPQSSASGHVTDNDIEFLGDTFVISAFDATGTNGGHITMVTSGADAGSFTYVSQAGFNGDDTFTYTIRDKGLDGVAGNSDDLIGVGTVTIHVTGRVWYVDSAASAGGDGTSTNPFNTITATNLGGAGGAGDVDSSGDYIYVKGSATGALPLENNQHLIGTGAALVVNSTTLAAAGSNSTLTAAGGTTVTLGTGNEVTGINITNSTVAGTAMSGTSFGTATISNVALDSAGQGLILNTGTVAGTGFNSVDSDGGVSNVSLTAVNGTVNLGGGALSGATGSAFNVSAGAASIDYNGNITHTGNANAIIVANHTAGTINLDGTVSSTGASDGISLTGNTGTTINFTNTLTLTTSASGTIAFNATGGGTVTATGSGSTISSGAGIGLNVVNTSIGTNDLTFVSISSSGASSGIVLNNTGTTASFGGLVVTGDATSAVNGSGGTISGSTGVGISLTSTRDVVLDQMNIQNGQNDGFNGSSVTNFTLTNSNVTGNGNAVGESGFDLTNLAGTAIIDNVVVRNSFSDNFKLINNTGVLDVLNVKNSTFDHTAIPTSPAGGNGFVITTQNSAVIIDASISNSTFRNNFSNGILVNTENTSRIGDDNALSSSTNGFVVSGNTFDDNNIAIQFGVFHSSDMTVDIQGNTIINNGRVATSGPNSTSTAVVVATSSLAGAGSTINARIENNIIGDAAIDGSASSTGSGIRVFIQGEADSTVLINNNTIREAPTGYGIEYKSIGSATTGLSIPTSDITITNNNVDHTNLPFKPGTSNFPLPAISVQADNAGSGGIVRADIAGNTVPAGTSFEFTGAFLELFEYDNAGSADGNLQLVDRAPTGAASATAELTANNTGSAAANAGVSLITGAINTPPNLSPLPLLAGGDPTAGFGPPMAGDPPSDGGTPPAGETPPAGTTLPGTAGSGFAGNITGLDLSGMIDAAMLRWMGAGLTDAQVAALNALNYAVADMAGLYLGSYQPGLITLDSDAAGHGWFVDTTPLDDSEFGTAQTPTWLLAGTSGAAGHYDLLTVLMHEMGHALGLSDNYDPAARDDLMYGTLYVGERHLAAAGEADGGVAGSILGEEFAGSPILVDSSNVSPSPSGFVLPAGKTVTIQWQATIDAQSNGLIVNPVNSGLVQASNAGSFPDANTNTVTTTLDTLILGGTIWNDNGNAGGIALNGIKDGGELGVSGVLVSLWVDANNDNAIDNEGGAPVASMLTNGSGDYSFTGLAPGNYIVRVDQDNFDAGGNVSLLNLRNSPITSPDQPDPDDNVNNDDNGSRAPNSAAYSKTITLAYNTEPTAGTGNDTNNTLDFGFFPNQPPTISNLNGDIETFTEDGAPLLLDDSSAPEVAATVADIDSPDFDTGNLTVAIAAGGVAAEDVLSIVAGNNITVAGNVVSFNGNAIGTFVGGSSGANLVVTFNSAAAMPAAVTALVGQIAYQNTNTATPNTGDRTVRFTVNDGDGGTSTSANSDVTVHVTAVNDAPVVVTPVAHYTVNEQTNLSLHGTGLSVSDVDASGGSETVTLSVGEGTITISAGNSGVGSISGSGSSSITFSGTIAQLNALLSGSSTGTIIYNDPTNTPSASTTLTLAIDDNGHSPSGNLTDSDTATIDITAVNDAPIAAMTTDPYAATEQTTLTLKGTGMSVSDADSLGGIETITLSVGQGALTVTEGDSGVTVVSGNSTASVVVSGTIAQLNALLGAGGTSDLTYFNNSDNPAASTTLTLAINDGGNTGTPGALTGNDTSTINITGLNDAPAAITPVTHYVVNEQTNLNLHGTGLSVSDADANSGSETVTLSVGEGTITISAGNSGVGSISGSGSSSITFSGTIAQLNALLSGSSTGTIVYNDPTNTPSASTTLTLQINDGGNSPSGNLTDSDTATIDITAVNDAPTATMTTDPYATAEQTTLVLKGTGMSVSDVDSLGGIETITLSVGQGALTVTEGDSGVTVVSGNSTASVVVSGTIAQLNALLGASGTSDLTYFNNSDNPAASTTLTLAINDGGNTGTPGALNGNDTSTINITAVNDAPELTDVTAGPVLYPAAPVTLDSAVTITDLDDTHLESATVTITDFFSGDVLSVNGVANGGPVNGISWTYAAGVLAFTGHGLLADYEALLEQVQYSSTNPNPSAGGPTRNVTWVINDGDDSNLTAPATTVTLDQPPVLSDAGNTVGYTEQAPAIFVDGSPSPFPTGISISDPDAPPVGNAINSATVTITGAVAGDFLDADNTGVAGISISWNGTDTLTLSGADTMADYEAVLRSVVFSSTSDDPTNGGANNSRTITWVVKDIFDVPSAPVTTTINITAVNDGPVAVITPTSFNATEQTALDLKAAGLSVSDPDANTNNVTVTLSVTEGTLTVTTGGSGIPAANIVGSGTGSVTITGTIAQINALLNTDLTSTVSYIDGIDNPSASATLTLAIDDGGNTGGSNLPASDTATISITAVNDGPVATITPASYNTTENITLNLKSNGLSVSDIDANAGNMTVTLSVTEGTLTVSAGGTTAIVSGSGTSSVTITGTVAQINALLDTDGTSVVQYTETVNAPAAAVTLTLAIDDNGNTGGGNLSNQDTATINITPANDAPTATITPASYSATENIALNLKSNGLAVSDASDGNLGGMTVTLSVTEGTLIVTAGGTGAGVAGSGTSSVTITGTVAQINALLDTDGTSVVQYTETDDSPSAAVTLTLAINDNGNTGGGPGLTAQDTATINITPANDAPTATITPPTYNATENITLNLKTNGLSVSDASDGNLGSMTVTLSVTEGTLNVQAGSSGAVVSGSPGTSVTITGTVAQINALLNTDGTSVVQYTETDDTPSAAVTLTLAINDNGNTGGGPGLTAQDTATINITATNDAPAIGNLTPSITYLAAAPPQTLSSGATVADPDSANLTSASVTLTDHQAGDELSVNGALVGGPINGISWSYNAGTGVLSFIGPSSLANYQALLDTVQYRSTSGDPSNGGTTTSRDVAWVVNDGTDPSVTQHTSINVGNQAPTVDLNGGGAGTNADQLYTENVGTQPVANASLTLADADDTNLASATIVLTNAKPGDTLGISGSLPAGITSSINTSVAGQITVTLSGNAARSSYQTAIQQVVFSNPTDNPDATDRIITVSVNDGQDSSNNAILTVHVNSLNDAPVNTVPGTQEIEANTSTAISGLSIADPDAASGSMTTTLSVQHGTLTVASLGGASVSGSGTGTVTLNGTLAAINATLASNNVVYKGELDFFGTDTLTVGTNDNGNTAVPPGGSQADTDQVTLHLNTLITGTPGNDSYNALPGQERIDAGLGIDTITFNFRLVDASVRYVGNKVIIDGPTGSHTVLTGFEVFNFTDGTVNNNDGSPLIDDLFYYSKYHDVWNAHVDADAHYNTFGWHEGRDPDAFFSTVVYLSSNPDVKASGVNPLTHFDIAGWKEGRVPSITFDPAQYLAANPDVKAGNIDPLRHYLANGYQEGRTPFAPSELIGATGFDYVYYLNHNPDIASSGVDPFQHFQTVGWHEGRNPNALFDVNGYLATYTDVHVNPLDHYNQFGWHEGRDPSVGFDTTSYLGAYADVNAAHINPLTHFLHYGIHEGRSPFADGVWG